MSIIIMILIMIITITLRQILAITTTDTNTNTNTHKQAVWFRTVTLLILLRRPRSWHAMMMHMHWC